ncbi:MAG: nitroreductase family protein [Nanoarchaeota archaeon]
MDVLECIRSRRSVRHYLSKEVEWEHVGRVVQAGKAAPSAGNQQNWKFIVVQDKAKRALISEACVQQYWMQHAPVHIVVVAEPQKARQFYGIRGERLYSIQNCAAAVQNMLLAAHSLGLGSCWVGAFDEDMVRRAVGIPEYVRPQSIVTLGHAAQIPAEPGEYRIYDLLHIEKWDRKIRDVNWVTKDYSVTIENKAKEKGAKLADHGKKAIHHTKEFFAKTKKRIKGS